MAVKELNEEAIFNLARKLDSRELRDDYLVQACGEDRALRARVDALLAVHEEEKSFLASPAAVIATSEERITESPGTMIGPYKLLEQIGEGGFGLVFMAEQLKPVRRKVAVKVLKPGMDTRHVIARFEAERQALALMDHAHIARVLDAGETASGRPYFAMELVRGIPITDYCDKNGLVPRQRLELFLTICHAVQHAHQKGIIHRDIKPSNVLITLHDGTPVAKVIDFGIAKALGQQLTDKTLYTGFAQLIGTPLYMSPEQAEMSGLDVDTRSDIYSLGVLLYELLTGTTPFDKDRLGKAGYDEILRIIREEEPTKPSTRLSTMGAAATVVSARRQSDPKRLSQLFRGELDWIVMKALEKERGRRYETASALAADIERYLHDQPVSACPPSTWYRFSKFARRHRMGLITAALVLLALVLGTAVSLWQALRATAAMNSERQTLIDLEKANQQVGQALHSAREAEKEKTEKLWQSYVSEARARRYSRRQGQRFQSLNAIREAAKIARERDMPRERFDLLRNEAIACLALPDLRPEKEWDGWPEGSFAVDFDGAFKHYARTDRRGTCYIHRMGDGAEVARLPGFADSEAYPTLSLDGRFVGVWYYPRAGFRLWRLDQSKPILLLDEPKNVSARGLDPDGRLLALGTTDGQLRLLELPSLRQLWRVQVAPKPQVVVFNSRQRQLAVSSNKSVIQVLALDSGKIVTQLAPAAGANEMAWHADSGTLAVAGNDYKLYLWDPATWKPGWVLEGHKNGGIKLAFQHGGDVLASADWDGMLRLWDVHSGRQTFQTQVRVRCVRFSPDDRLMPVSTGNNMALSEVACGRTYRTLSRSAATGKGKLVGPTISPDGRLLAVGMDDGVGLWDLSSGKQLDWLRIGPHWHVLFEPSGALLTNGVLRWPVQPDPNEAGRLLLGPAQRLPMPVTSPAQSVDGRVMAGTQYDGALVWHRQPPGRIIRLGPHPDTRYIAVSPNGQWVATGSHNGTGCKVWDAHTGKLLQDLVPNEQVVYVKFSPDGCWLVTGSGGGRVWETGSWREEPRFRGRGIMAVFSPDSKLMIDTPSHGVLRLTRMEDGRELARLEDPNQDEAWYVAFSPDGTQLVTPTKHSGTIHVWDLRAIRKELADMGLDWGMPPYPDAQIPNAIESVIVDMSNVGAGAQPAAGRDAFLAPLAACSLQIAFAPIHPQPYFQRAKIYFARGQYQEALTDLSTALHWTPGDPKSQANVYAMRGHVYWRLNRDAETRADLERALQLDPRNAAVCNSLAWFHVTRPPEQRDPNKALVLARQAVELVPERWEYWNTLGVTYYRLAEYTKAIVALERSLRRNNEMSGFDLYFLAMCHQRIGDAAHARTCLGRANHWALEHQAALPPDQHAELRAFRSEAEEVVAKK